MKGILNLKLVWRSVISCSVAVFFMILFSGSLSLFFLEDETKVLENGDYEMTVYLSEDDKIEKTGPKDYYGRWHGPVKIVHERPSIGSGTTIYTTEEVNLVHGKKHGMGKITTSVTGSLPTETFVCYNMGQVVDCEKSAIIATENLSAYQILENKYPWYLPILNIYSFDTTYVESFTDTLELVLSAYDFDAEEFDIYYEEALGEIDETPYDSIIVLNLSLTLFQALEQMKNHDFRLAVIDGYNENDFNTYGSIQMGYENYLIALNDSGILNYDFEVFCHAFDSLMVSYGELDANNPFFIDSLDSRMFRAMDYISSYDPDTESSLLALKSTGFSKKQLSWERLYTMLRYALKSGSIDPTSKRISETILFSTLSDYFNADLIRQAVREAYMMDNGLVRFPVVTTQLQEEPSGNSVSVKGTVIENGGAVISERGIVWAESYNPTTSDQVVNSGSGTGDFYGPASGLESGKTYYARAFAINSAGTAYGNNVRISASQATGLMDTEFSGFKVFPNPATDVVNFSFTNYTGENLVLTIVDLNGRIVYKENLKRGKLQENQIKLNVSNFENGIYNCQLANGKKHIMRKLVVAK